MKFPALPIAACVAAGILAAGLPSLRMPHFVPICLASGALFLAIGFGLFSFGRTSAAATASLLAWCCLGGAARIEALRIPPQHVTQLVQRGELNLDQPLRWRGRLRADPLRLPWGTRYDIDLEQAQSAGAWRAISGGLRLTYYLNERSPQPVRDLRAGDRIETLARARSPRNYGDPGAFDDRAFLAQQGIDLTASLRSTELVERFPALRPLSRIVSRASVAACWPSLMACSEAPTAMRRSRELCC